MGNVTVPAVRLARRIAVETGDFLFANLRRKRTISSKKGRGNLVTEMDLASERRILGAIRKRFPDHMIVAEESGSSGKADCKWYVDPLDGTANYAHGLPLFCVSIGFEMAGRLEAGVVYCPGLGELYEGRRGHGARCNGRVLHGSKERRLDRALLCTGFSYQMKYRLTNLRVWDAFVRKAQAVRRLGSAALDLCFTAAGIFDGFWEYRLGPWDIAAAAVIAREAGLEVTDIGGGPLDLVSGDVLAANPSMHATMMSVLRKTGGIR